MINDKNNDSSRRQNNVGYYEINERSTKYRGRYRVSTVIDQVADVFKADLKDPCSQLEITSFRKAPRRKISEYVKRMQYRIAYAAKNKQRLDKLRYMDELASSNAIRFYAVQHVCVNNRGRNTAGVDNILDDKARCELAYSLKMGEGASYIRRVEIPKPGTNKTRPLGIPTIYDRCIQYIICQVLEPAAEATYLDANSYGYRPGRGCWDAIRQLGIIMKSGHHRWVLDADIAACFPSIDHDYIMSKLDLPDNLKTQTLAFLKAGILTGFPNSQGGFEPSRIITNRNELSALLCNIALDGLETHLKDYAMTLYESDKATMRGKSGIRGAQGVKSRVGFVRYADDFIVTHHCQKTLRLLREATESWLKRMGLHLSPEKTAIRSATQGWDFLGFSLILVKYGTERKKKHTGGKYKLSVMPSRTSKKRLLKKVDDLIRTNFTTNKKCLRTFITRFRKMIIGWGNYYAVSMVSKSYNKLDNVIWLKLSRHIRKLYPKKRRFWFGRYYPKGKTYTYNLREYQDNWVFSHPWDTSANSFIPKLSWILSRQHVKVQGHKTPYDGDVCYWSNRIAKYSANSPLTQKLIIKQKGICTSCHEAITVFDTTEIDHIIPKWKKPEKVDSLKNLQLLHYHCHLEKTSREATERANVKRKDLI
jgi:RNA-directed DNA polymerase